MQIQMALHGLADVKYTMKAVENRASDQARFTRVAAVIVTDEAKKAAPKRRGFFHRSIKYRMLPTTAAIVGSDHPAAASLERGSGVYAGRGHYLIKPKIKKVLAVVNVAQQKRDFQEAAGKGFPVVTMPDGTQAVVFGRVVRHPGVKAQYWLSRGVRNARPRVLNAVGMEFKAQIYKATKH